MATTVVLKDVIKSGSIVRIRFASGFEYEFSSLEQLTEWVSEVDTTDVVQKLCVAWAQARSADLSNIATIRNKDFIFDPAAANMIRVQ